MGEDVKDFTKRKVESTSEQGRKGMLNSGNIGMDKKMQASSQVTKLYNKILKFICIEIGVKMRYLLKAAVHTRVLLWFMPRYFQILEMAVF